MTREPLVSSLRLGACVLAVCAVMLLLLGPFWVFDDSSSWAAVIRILLTLTLVLTLLQLPWCLPVDNYVVSLVLIFFAYLILNGILVADSTQPLRRLVVIGGFLFAGVVLGRARPEVWRWLIAIAVVVAALFAGFSMVSLFIRGEFTLAYREMNLSRSAVDGIADFGNTIVAGMHYAFFLVSGFWLMLRSRRVSERSLWAVCCLFLLGYVYFTFSRTAWAASVIGMLIVTWQGTSIRQRRSGMIAISSVIGVCVLIGFRQMSYEVKTRGLTGRNFVWDSVMERLSGHFLLGRGAGVPLGEVTLHTGQVVHNTHSLYMEVLFQFGVIGLVLLAALLMLCLVKLARQPSEVAVLWLALLAGMSVVMLVELHTFVGSPSLIWMWLWLPIAGAMIPASAERECAAA